MKLARVGLIGFGATGASLAADLAAQGLKVRAYDRLSDSVAGRQTLRRRARAVGVILCTSVAKACHDADLLISAVSAGSAVAVARVLTAYLRPGQIYLDINSVAPATKQAACALVQASGADYIEAALMAPLPPQCLRPSMLLCGARATTLAAGLNALGGDCRAVAGRVGTAAAIKMCHSMLIKGLEALTCESLATARHYGAEREVLAALHKSFPGMGWNGALPDHLISRVAEYGPHRAEEMREMTATVANAGIATHMSHATAQAQRALGEAMEARGLGRDDLQPFRWTQLMAQLGA